MKDYQKEFCNLIDKFSHKYSRWDVWNDFLYMSAVSMANCVPTPEREEREQNYLKIIKKYTEEEQHAFIEMFAITAMALEEKPEQDFLGGLYHKLNLQQHQKGQFFTPYHIAQFMSEITFAGNDVYTDLDKKGYITVNDPACGAGVMLIAFANTCRKHKLNYQQNVLFIAQDIDRTAVFMCYIQLALLGCNAVVIRGDSLVKPGFHSDNDFWYTPMYYLNHWRFKDFFTDEEEKHVVKEVEPTVKIDYKVDKNGQLSLSL